MTEISGSTTQTANGEIAQSLPLSEARKEIVIQQQLVVHGPVRAYCESSRHCESDINLILVEFSESFFGADPSIELELGSALWK